MNKIDFSDVSFLIPVRIDSVHRIENTVMVTDFLLSNLKTKVYVLEADAYQNGILRQVLNEGVDYVFVTDYDNIFHRTKYINQMVALAKSKFVAIWDSDIIIPIPQLIEALAKLRDGIDAVYPYSGCFYDTSRLLREGFWENRDIQFLQKNIAKMKLIYGENMKGGAFMINRSVYWKIGGEDERFYGWGPEDWERHERWKRLGLSIHLCKGVLFHLTHQRGINSMFRNLSQMRSSNRLYKRTLSSSNRELQNEIAAKMDFALHFKCNSGNNTNERI